MSGIKAIQPSAVSFEGKNKAKKSSEKKKDGFASKFTKPFKDDFEKTYSIKAKDATSDMKFDYVTDKIFKGAVLVGSVALLAAKSRKATNGLTKAIKNQFLAGKEAMQQQNSEGAKKAAKGIISKIRNVFGEVKEANAKRAQEAFEAAKAEGKEISVAQTVKDAIFMPVEKFNDESKLAKFIDKSTDRSAKILNKLGIKVDGNAAANNIKKGLAKVGIADGSQLADTAIAAGATTAGTLASVSVADDATKADNASLSIAAKTGKFVNNFEKHLDAADKVTDLIGLIGV